MIPVPEVFVWVSVCVETVGREVSFAAFPRLARFILMTTFPPAARSLRVAGAHEGLLGPQPGMCWSNPRVCGFTPKSVGAAPGSVGSALGCAGGSLWRGTRGVLP